MLLPVLIQVGLVRYNLCSCLYTALLKFIASCTHSELEAEQIQRSLYSQLMVRCPDRHIHLCQLVLSTSVFRQNVVDRIIRVKYWVCNPVSLHLPLRLT